MEALVATAPWWAWPVALFVACFFLGIIAVPAGVGGGVLFVPIIAGFFPFHLDFVRGAGLLVALSGALSAGPRLLDYGLANLRLALPFALVSSVSSIGGAFLGLALPAAAVQTALGVVILVITGLMIGAKNTGIPHVERQDSLSQALRLHGVFVDGATQREIHWRAHRAPLSIFFFILIGIIAGMFGLGAGWANVPALNLVMGVPLKVAAGTSSFIISPAAAFVYLNEGALLPMIAAPSVLGMMLGARLGGRVLNRVPAATIRRLVIALMILAGLRALGKGLGLWT